MEVEQHSIVSGVVLDEEKGYINMNSVSGVTLGFCEPVKIGVGV